MMFSAPDPLHWLLLVAFISVVLAVVFIVVFVPRRPIPMILFCPTCGHQHIDKNEWTTRQHRKHLCENCGGIWKPSNVYTVGVEFLPPQD